jgi:hypothetical protein
MLSTKTIARVFLGYDIAEDADDGAQQPGNAGGSNGAGKDTSTGSKAERGGSGQDQSVSTDCVSSAPAVGVSELILVSSPCPLQSQRRGGRAPRPG